MSPDPARVEARATTPATQLAEFLSARTATCNAASLATYRAYLTPFIAWLDGRPISALTVSAYLAELRGRTLAPATIGNAHRILKTFCRYLVEQELLSRDPFDGPGRVRPPAHKRKRRRVYSEDQVVQLLVTAQARIVARQEEEALRPSANPFLLRDAIQARALVLLLCDSALRAAEICALSCGQVRAGELIVRSKGGHDDAAFITPATRSALLELAGDRPDDDPLFRDIRRQRCTTRALRGIVVRLATAAGVGLVPRPLHAFRHFAARQWLKSGLQDLTIMQLMRHQDLATTRIYTDLDAVELAALHAKASPVARMLAEATRRHDEES